VRRFTGRHADNFKTVKTSIKRLRVNQQEAGLDFISRKNS
jgi:ribosomal protein S2